MAFKISLYLKKVKLFIRKKIRLPTKNRFYCRNVKKLRKNASPTAKKSFSAFEYTLSSGNHHDFAIFSFRETIAFC